jgi:hypothetical protein
MPATLFRRLALLGAFALQQRFDEQFSAAVNNVGAAEPGKPAAGAASLLRFATWRDGAYQREILAYLAAQLRIGVEAKVKPLLVDLLGGVLREGAAEQRTDFAQADFTAADVNDTYFLGATFDPAALATLARAKKLTRRTSTTTYGPRWTSCGRPRRPGRKRRWLSASRTAARSRASAGPCRSTAASRCPRPAG